MTRAVLILAIAVFCAGGCESYSTRRFQSSSADILYEGYWSTPRYRLIFDEQVIEGNQHSVDFTFAHPPEMPMRVVLNLVDDADLDALVNANAIIRVSIVDELGECAFDFSGTVTRSHRADDAWFIGSMLAIEPPEEWNHEQRGQRLDLNDFSKSGAPQRGLWRFSPDGTVLTAPKIVELKDQAYSLRLIIETGDLETKARILPMLTGGSRGVL